MKKILIAILSILLLSFDAQAEPDYELPVDLVPGMKPNPMCYTENGYVDDSLTVRMEKVTYNNVRVNLAWIEVASPTQLRTAIYGKEDVYLEGDGGTIFRANNGVVAINGDMFTRREGIIYREGVALKQTESPNKDALFIDENGDFHIIPGSSPERMIEYLRQGHQIVNSFAFGPALVIDGEVQQIPDDYWFEPEGRCQRTAVCQMGEKKYLFVEVIGRTLESRGFTMQQLADYLGTLGVQNAYNLDGGDSSVMFFNRSFFDHDHHYVGIDRVTADIIYVCSAVDPATWEGNN